MDLFKQEGTSNIKSNHKTFIKFKIQIKSLRRSLRLLKMVMCLRFVSRDLFARCLILKIEIAKKLLIIEVEKGLEAFIPDELSTDCLPYSFRYYDSLFSTIQDSISDDVANIQGFKASQKKL